MPQEGCVKAEANSLSPLASLRHETRAGNSSGTVATSRRLHGRETPIGKHVQAKSVGRSNSIWSRASTP